MGEEWQELLLPGNCQWQRAPLLGERHTYLPLLSLSVCIKKAAKQDLGGWSYTLGFSSDRWGLARKATPREKGNGLTVGRRLLRCQLAESTPTWSLSPGWGLQTSGCEPTARLMLTEQGYCFKTFSPEGLTPSPGIKPKRNEVVSGTRELHFGHLEMHTSWHTLNLPSSPSMLLFLLPLSYHLSSLADIAQRHLAYLSRNGLLAPSSLTIHCAHFRATLLQVFHTSMSSSDLCSHSLRAGGLSASDG